MSSNRPIGSDVSSNHDAGISGDFIGELAVTAKLALGVERLRLVFTRGGILIIHIGKGGTGAAAASSLLGKYGPGFEDLVRRMVRRSRPGSHRKPEALLEMNNDNFQVAFEEVVRLELSRGRSQNSLLLITQNEKLEFLVQGRVPQGLVVELKAILGDRMSLKEL